MAVERKPAAKAKPAAARKPVAPRVTLPTLSKGTRPEFYEDPAIDQLFAIVTALTGEISVAFDRIDALERVLVQARALAPGAVESFVADGEATLLRETRRDALLHRVFAVFEAYAARHSARERAPEREPAPDRQRARPRRSSRK